MSETREVDVVVIGMGPGGEDAAGRLAAAGLKVIGVEAELVGGECPYWACVPSKTLIRAANLVAEARRADGRAGTATVAPDLGPVAKKIREDVTADWDDTAAVKRFTDNGGELLRGRGRITGPGEVTVELNPDDAPKLRPRSDLDPHHAGEIGGGGGGTVVVRARKAVVIGTGTVPALPPIDGLTDVPFWTNREAISATEAPESLIVLGGGPIGVELAQVYARFGSKVTLVQGGPRLVPREEPEASEVLADVLRAEGVEVVLDGKATHAAFDGSRFSLTVGDQAFVAEKLLVATGRKVDLAGVGIGALGLDDTARTLAVDDRCRVEGAGDVWAVGDVTGEGAFTHVAVYQGGIVAASVLGEDHYPAEYAALPRVTFTDPEIGSVGLTEEQAREQGLNIRVGSTQVADSTRGWIHGSPGNEGFIKLVEDADRGVLVGATSMGPVGGEVLSALAVAVHGAVPTSRLESMIYAYPTFHRGISASLAELK